MRSGLPVLSGELTKKAPLGFGGARRSLGAAIVGQHTSRTATPSGSPLFIARCRRMLIDQNYPERQATVNGRAIRRTAGFGASRPLPRVAATVRFLITERAFSLGRGNASSCPIPAIDRRLPDVAADALLAEPVAMTLLVVWNFRTSKSV